MFAIWCEESVCHFIQTIGFNAEMFVPRAKGFLKDTKLPFKLLKLWHLPCSGNSESYLLLGTVSINKQLRPWNEILHFASKRAAVSAADHVEQGVGRGGGWGLRGRTESIAFYQYGVNCSKRSQYMHLLFKKIMHTVTYNLTRTMWLSDLSSGDHPDNHSDSRTEAISVQ